MILSVTCWPANVRLRLLLYDALVIVMCYTDILCDPYSSSFFFISLDIVRVYRIKSFASPPFLLIPFLGYRWGQQKPSFSTSVSFSSMFLAGIIRAALAWWPCPEWNILYILGGMIISSSHHLLLFPPPIFFFARHYITWYTILVELLPCKRGLHSLDVTVSVALTL